MRDPNRIDGILAKVKEMWEKYPDLRLGQLLSNAVGEGWLYYVEDDSLIDEMEKLYLGDSHE